MEPRFASCPRIRHVTSDTFAAYGIENLSYESPLQNQSHPITRSHGAAGQLCGRSRRAERDTCCRGATSAHAGGLGRQALVQAPKRWRASLAGHANNTRGLGRFHRWAGPLGFRSAAPARSGRSVVTVTASQALVAKWLLPRLESFTTAHPELDVRLDVTDRTLDLAKGDADIGLRCGPGQWPGLHSELLMREEIFPVASPDLFGKTHAPRTPAQLLRYTLLHDVALQVSGAFPSWSQWFDAQAVADSQAASKGLHINASAAVIQAAINGQGIALVRAALVRDDLAANRLIRLCPKISWPLAWAYYVVSSPEALQEPHVRTFHDWLMRFKNAASA
jgi:LysR family transcriptional regulator, glycine cleavage system transcriptional activator